ncbi:MAG: DUF4360 domain-containing protein [Halobacteriovoraceae bacterium]|nr:DUF4360 domain-containing protein [Halobacteriovoraceae bacterium]MBT5094855.1 DUF4360 domain-containing protein [Halobacteriovoraceae bacterium]
MKKKEYNNDKTIKATVMNALLLGLLIFIIANASEGATLTKDLSFDSVSARGTGCPDGTTSIVESPDGQTVSILFDEMISEVPQFDGDNDNDAESDQNRRRGRRSNTNLSHKMCYIIINSKVAEGHKVKSLEISVDFRGSTFMDQGTQALFNSQFVQWRGIKRITKRAANSLARKVWRSGPVEEDWTITGNKNIPIMSNCGRHGQRDLQFSLRNVIKTQIKPGYTGGESSAFMSLDSADLAGKITVKVHTEKCGAVNGGGHGGGQGGGGVHPPRPPRPQICPRGYRKDPRTRRCIPYRGGRPTRPGRGRGHGRSTHWPY